MLGANEVVSLDVSVIREEFGEFYKSTRIRQTPGMREIKYFSCGGIISRVARNSVGKAINCRRRKL